ncbi:MAG: hypothetical protein JO316_05410 [Abitibacteriaceae bacterium]|nr:hypothetical protein [Abditibacteriaceae bacterium]
MHFIFPGTRGIARECSVRQSKPPVTAAVAPQVVHVLAAPVDGLRGDVSGPLPHFQNHERRGQRQAQIDAPVATLALGFNGATWREPGNSR